MQVLVILEVSAGVGCRARTALRLAGALIRSEDTSVRVFIVDDETDAANASRHGRDDPLFTSLVGDLVAAGVEVRATRASPDAAGPLSAIGRMLGVEPSTFRDLSSWTLEADRVLVF